MYLYILLGNLESFLIKNREEIEKLLNKNQFKLEDGLTVLESFNSSLVKTSQILENLEDLEGDEELIKSVIILIAESLSWILFTLPTLPEKLPFFREEFLIKNENVLDIIGNNLINLESFLEKPSEIFFLIRNLKNSINDILNVINFLQRGLEKSLIVN